MAESNMGAIIIGRLIGGLIGGLIGSLIAAIFLRAASKWIAKLDVPFGKAYWTVYISFIANFVIGFVLGSMATGSEGAVEILMIVLLPVNFFIQSWIIGSRLELSFGKACFVSITMLGLCIGIVLVVGIVIYLSGVMDMSVPA